MNKTWHIHAIDKHGRTVFHTKAESHKILVEVYLQWFTDTPKAAAQAVTTVIYQLDE